MEEEVKVVNPKDGLEESSDVTKLGIASSHPVPTKEKHGDLTSKVEQETNEEREPEPVAENKHSETLKPSETEESKQVSEHKNEHKIPENLESKAIQDTEIVKSQTEDAPPKEAKSEDLVKSDPDPAPISDPPHKPQEPENPEVPDASSSHPPPASDTKDPSPPLHNFSIHYNTNYGEKIVVVGSSPELGNWDASKGLNLEWSEGNLWKASTPINSDSIEYKYVCVSEDHARWEDGENRKISATRTNESDTWQ